MDTEVEGEEPSLSQLEHGITKLGGELQTYLNYFEFLRFWKEEYNCTVQYIHLEIVNKGEVKH